MRTGLLDQLDTYFTDVDAEQGPVSPDEVADLVDRIRAMPSTPEPVRRRPRVWIAVAAAAAAILLIGLIPMLTGGESAPPADTIVPTTSTPTTVAEESSPPATTAELTTTYYPIGLPRSESGAIEEALGQLTWTRLTGDNSTIPITRISAIPSHGYTAIGDGGIWNSEDGLTWDFRDHPLLDPTNGCCTFFDAGSGFGFSTTADGTGYLWEMGSNGWAVLDRPDGTASWPGPKPATNGDVTLLLDEETARIWMRVDRGGWNELEGEAPFEAIGPDWDPADPSAPLRASGILTVPDGGFLVYELPYGSSYAGVWFDENLTELAGSAWILDEDFAWSRHRLPQFLDDPSIEGATIMNQGQRLIAHIRLTNQTSWERSSSNGLDWSEAVRVPDGWPEATDFGAVDADPPNRCGFWISLDHATWAWRPGPWSGNCPTETGATGDILYGHWGTDFPQRVLWIGRFEK